MYLRHTLHGNWLNQHVPLLLWPSTWEPLLTPCDSPLSIWFSCHRSETFNSLLQCNQHSSQSIVTWTSTDSLTLLYPFLRPFSSTAIAWMPVLSFLLSLVLGFIIWRVCVMSTCQTHLFPCQCFHQYWFELQLNRYSIYSLLLCVVSVGLYIEFMPATVILKLCLTFVSVAALLYRWIGRAGILLEFIFTRVWNFDGVNALLGLYFYNYFCFTSMPFYF